MNTSISYRAVPSPTMFNFIVFVVSFAQGAYEGQRVGQAFMNEFQYSEGPGFEGLWEERDQVKAWSQIAKIMEAYQHV